MLDRREETLYYYSQVFFVDLKVYFKFGTHCFFLEYRLFVESATKFAYACGFSLLGLYF